MEVGLEERREGGFIYRDVINGRRERKIGLRFRTSSIMVWPCVLSNRDFPPS